MKWVEHVALWGKREMHIGFWYENLRERYYLDDPGVHGKILLKRILKRSVWTGFIWLGIGISGGLL